MKLLVIGGGGREHALAWSLTRSDKVEKIFVAPGNAGTAREANVENVAIDTMDFAGLVAFAKEQDIAFTVVGPEAPLVAGVVDYFEAQGLRCFGPRKAPAQLEGSKSFTKDFLQRHNIPTAAYAVFTDPAAAIDYLQTMDIPVVIKADGLAAGKGVIIAETFDDAVATVKDMLEGNAFGEAGHRVVIEEFMRGEEASFIVMVDGEHILPLASSQDHKRRDDGDGGPNTGGMGAYSPAPVVTEAVHDHIMRDVIEPTVAGLAAEGMPYTGFLYAGLMIDAQGQARVVEYNCRFGDPETQPVLMRLQSDLATLIEATFTQSLGNTRASWDPRPAVGVVLAAGGYPAKYEKGQAISGLEAKVDDSKVFHAGTRLDGDTVLSNGGRVLCVTALGANVSTAQSVCYRHVQQIQFKDMYYRTDIAYRAIAREF